MGSYSMALVYPPTLSPLPWVRATHRSTPFSGRLGLRVISVKLETLNAFYGHLRSFAHPKPYIKNDQRKKIYNPVLIVFRYQKTCLGREEPAVVESKVSEHIYQCGDEEEPWDITDELIASFQEEGRCKKRSGQPAKILRRTTIPVDSLKFVAC
jgi:hypothetical protein